MFNSSSREVVGHAVSERIVDEVRYEIMHGEIVKLIESGKLNRPRFRDRL